MLGFTLSKINLLILVTATFAIVAFFMISLSGVVIRISAQQMVSAYSEKAANVITSESLCFRTGLTIQRNISYFGGIAEPKRFFYKMHIWRYPEDYDEEYLTSVIFAISDRKDDDKVIASKKIDVNAQVIFYDWNPEKDLAHVDGDAKSVTLDAESAILRKDSLVLFKEVLLGKSYLHIIACSSEGTCPTNCEAASEILASQRGSESNCVNPKSCSDLRV